MSFLKKLGLGLLVLGATQGVQAAKYQVTIDRGESPYFVKCEGEEIEMRGQYGPKKESFEVYMPKIAEYESLLARLNTKGLSPQGKEEINAKLKENIINQIKEEPENKVFIKNLDEEIKKVSKHLWEGFFSDATYKCLKDILSKTMQDTKVHFSDNTDQPFLLKLNEESDQLFDYNKILLELIKKDENREKEYAEMLNLLILFNLREAFRQAVSGKEGNGYSENEEYRLIVEVKRINTEAMEIE